MKDIFIELAEESCKFGFAVTYDGDDHKVLFGQTCNRCNTYFESNDLEIYCDDCKQIKSNFHLEELCQINGF